MDNFDSTEKSTENKGKKQEIFKEIISWVLYIVGAAFIAFFLTRFVIVNAYVPTGSMESTIMSKDRIIASRLHYLTKGPQRGDIVVFRFPDNEEVLFVKRVIGLPKETVEIKDGAVYIDGVILEEPYIKEDMKGDLGIYYIPDDSYFMLGDNRNSSNDSRKWDNKFVKRDKILGKALFKYYPGVKLLW
ncbi:MAG: signal peptidase I [Clostridium sp.]|nr:signal peptidase I [Clostridium sp.]